MLEIASQIILCLLLAALLGFIIGYFMGKSTCTNSVSCNESTQEENKEEQIEQATITPTEPVTHTPSIVLETTGEETPEEQEPLLLSEARNGQKDNLTRIKGIGIKIEATLNEIGIYHFDQIANWTEEHIAWVDTNVAFPGRVKREAWVPQAKALASGEETEFSKRVDAGEVSSSKQS